MLKCSNERVRHLETGTIGNLLAIFGSNMMCLCVVKVGNKLETWYDTDIEFLEDIDL